MSARLFMVLSIVHDEFYFPVAQFKIRSLSTLILLNCFTLLFIADQGFLFDDGAHK